LIKNNVTRPHRAAQSTVNEASIDEGNKSNEMSFLVYEKPSGAQLNLEPVVPVQQALLNKVRESNKTSSLTQDTGDNSYDIISHDIHWPHATTYTHRRYMRSQLSTIFEDTSSLDDAVTDVSISHQSLSTMMSRTNIPTMRNCTSTTMQIRDRGSLQVNSYGQQTESQIPGFGSSSATTSKYNTVRDTSNTLQRRASEETDNFEALSNYFSRDGSKQPLACDTVENETRTETAKIEVSKKNRSSENIELQRKLDISDTEPTATRNEVLSSRCDSSSQEKCFQRIADIGKQCNRLFAYLVSTSSNTVRCEQTLTIVHKVLEFFADETLPYPPIRPPDKLEQHGGNV